MPMAALCIRSPINLFFVLVQLGAQMHSTWLDLPRSRACLGPIPHGGALMGMQLTVMDM